MFQVKHIFQEHENEINLFYDFLDFVINHDGRIIIDPPTNNIVSINIDTTAILKSSFILMLYNCVESTVVNCINTIIRKIEEDSCLYADLTDSLQIASLAAYEYKLEECESRNDRGKYLKQQADFISGVSQFNIDIKSFTGSSSKGSFSGSLDAREIRKIFGRMAVDLTSLKCNEMAKIKDGRNKLAHGEQSFQEYGRGLSIQYLHQCMDHTLTYLRELINQVDTYVTNKSYKR